MEGPQVCNSNSSSNSSTSSTSSDSMAVINLPALKMPTNLTSQDILPLSNLVHSFNSILTTRDKAQTEMVNSSLKAIAESMLEAKEKSNMVIDLLLEAKKKDDEMLKLSNEILKLQREAKEKDEEMLKLQQQALDRLAILQRHASAILVQNFELHEYPIPRLFIVLPVDTTKWDPRNLLRSKVRLHFLCECGEHTATISKSNQIHIAKHEGYDILNSTEFFHKYGKYMLILLHSLKMKSPLTASLASIPKLDAGIDYSIKYMKALSNEYSVLSKINEIDDFEVLEGADLRQLRKFLENNDESKQLGNLYRITTETGHVKWVCLDHYRWTYREAEQKAFKKVVELNGGEYDLHLGKVTITLESKTTAEEFFDALANARRVYELDIIFDWDWTKADLEAFEEALKTSSVSILRLELGDFQESISWKILSTSSPYETLARMIELSSMKTIHIVLPPKTIKVPSLRFNRPSHLRNLTIEMQPRIGFNDFRVLASALKADTAITTLNLRGKSIGDEGALALSEALKTNRTLTTLDLGSNRIRKEGALALSEALKANTTLTTLNMRKNPIGNEGALALSEALKTNTTLTALYLRDNSIGNEGALALSESLKANATLTNLDLYSNSIEKEGALALSEALKTNTSLTGLGLNSNSIGDEGALALSEALKTNTTLTTLDLMGNRIERKGALALSEALKTNTTLITLDLEYDSLGKEGALLLSKINTTLDTLDFESQSLGVEGAYAIAEALKANTTLTALSLEVNSIGSEGALALSETLKVNTTLIGLGLGYNSIGDEGALALSEALKTNTGLTGLNLYNNSIGKEGALALSEARKGLTQP
ncbi:hypothetical protein BX616_011059 [Lobosporangium transversale]|nr:hypothetical protein BX616_011059 [Lobosporangium transversale]